MATSVPAVKPCLTARFPLLEPLADRNFAVYWAGRVISLCGDQFQTVALAIVALDLTHSTSGLGTVLAVQAVPRAVLMLFGGVATDRFQARSVMLASDTLQTLVVAALAALAFTGHLSLPVLLGYAALSGTVYAFFLPAAGTMVPELVPRERVRAANALTATAQSLALAIPCYALSGVFGSAGGVIFTTLIQLRPPEAQRGGVMALWSLAIFGLSPVALALAGAIGAVLSPRGILLFGALCIGVSGLIGLASRQMREAA